MATAAQVCKFILLEILEQGESDSFEQDDYQSCIFQMNNTMLELDADGVKLGYTVVSNLADEVTVPPGALNGLIKNVAVALANQFDIAVSASLAMEARNGLRVMKRLGTQIPELYFPSTLPRGAGNEFDNFGCTDPFYPGPPAPVEGENNGPILLEDNT